VQWHAIGSAIRDAQEIGLHRDNLDPKPKSDEPSVVLENEWEVQSRRRLWMVLSGWDFHTAVVLGRPTTINAMKVSSTLPVDAVPPTDRSKDAIVPRTENDMPTPLTRGIWVYNMMAPLREILELEKEAPGPLVSSKVEKAHHRLLELEKELPAPFRIDNPDTRFDNLPGCSWIPYARVTSPQFISFNFMALHRPYIFTIPKSRTAALRASLDMLHSHRQTFQALQPEQYKA
jgi:Fungal specific transcription factor domain